MPSQQLLTRTIFTNGTLAAGQILEIKFNTPRGKIARVLGASAAIDAVDSDRYAIIIRKNSGAPFSLRPTDMLMFFNWVRVTNGAGFVLAYDDKHHNLPKPHRTNSVSVQINSTVNRANSDVVVILYYDIDDALKGEATQALEKSVLRGRTRRTREFD